MHPGFAGSIAYVAPLLVFASIGLVQAQPATGTDRCGEVVRIATHDNSTTRYAFVPPPQAQASRITLLLLPGGSGHVNLDDKACPRALKGNSLVRSIPVFNAAGFGAALLDAPSDFQGEDGLAGFRSAPQHAVDIGKVIADLRVRSGCLICPPRTSILPYSAHRCSVGITLPGLSRPAGSKRA
jgi:hypothetical protein